MNELIAMYALNYVVDNTTDGRQAIADVLTTSDLGLFAEWAESTEPSGTDVMDAVLEIIVNKVNELKGI